ncbi:MAG TPA: UDP-N-acetylmuramoyl-L-alanine--D-glutamate ligase [Rhizobiales bacterium]|nr:UDP-N-acetylmuramoylalanine--D-glutamate ligase [bacterium BMS3Bbin10]HDO52796.1 UDP-N-acetylmuramoyl-L-alanine--D-glutamate ligase [Hyphomicrobiales bacterium]
MIPIHVFDGKTVALFGLGLSGVASARALRAGGARVLAWDDAESSRDAAASQGIEIVDLRDADWGSCAALILAPGVPLTHPEPHWSVKKAREANVEIIGDTELFFRERKRLGSKARVVAITGTNGKSTTAALTAHVLRSGGLKASLGGNIGTAILDLPPFSETGVYVIEFSSYQIDLTPGLEADAAALLNITPDHLDRHGTLENYAAIKARIFSGLKGSGLAVAGIDDEHCRAITDTLEGAFAVAQISTLERVADGVSGVDGVLREWREGKEVSSLDLTGIGSLRGAHNAQNAAICYALARGLGLGPEAIARGLKSFPGLEHRMEEVGRLGKVLFINDSKGTNADAAAHALASFDDIYWIAGGLAKTGGIESLRQYFPRIVHAYLIGEAGQDFARTLAGEVDHTICGTLDKAVAAAAADAAASEAAEPAVLLSPACASFDQYRSFAVRGDAFRAEVSNLDGVVMQGSESA